MKIMFIFTLFVCNIFKTGSGHDVITVDLSNTEDKLVLSDIITAMNGTDLLVTYQGDQGTITIKDWVTNPIGKIMFANGTTLKDFKL